MNSLITYLWRDASNYKKWNSVVIPGIFTAEQETAVRNSLIDGVYFYPQAIGLPAETLDGSYEDDPDWFEFCDIEPTDAPPTIDMTPAQLVAKLCGFNHPVEDREETPFDPDRVPARRRIFRGKRNDQYAINSPRRGWVIGQLMQYWHEDGSCLSNIIADDGVGYGVFNGSLGDYTGFESTNGEMVFEGDFLKFKFDGYGDNNEYGCDDNNEYGLVFWDETRGRWSIQFFVDGVTGGDRAVDELAGFFQTAAEITIIGNRFDNPNLLEHY